MYALLVFQADELNLLTLLKGGGAVMSVVVSAVLVWKGMRCINKNCADERTAMQLAHVKERETSRNDFIAALRADREISKDSAEKLAEAIERLKTAMQDK